MKAYLYELDYRIPEEDYIVSVGYFTSLPEVRKYINGTKDDPGLFSCWRHPFNPEGAYDPVQVQIFRK
ncbi:hypothetical protein ADU18_0009 [Cronobacter phage PBES 02]|uniref:Uncharacterized protein n=1 Tax=Cronobacter phage PBES 02 TaxID=1684115 RepID=A0A0K1YAJ4_9CAUD|nr:hypothetical protein ADU18_0009 [Cronobacter phage PBES 02]AKY03914.1 hypothetical protein ADU18_0009 [Cronobacter phage PBES 02]